MKLALFVLVSLGMMGLGIHMGKSTVENNCRYQRLIDIKVTQKDGTKVDATYLCLQVTLPSK